MEIALIIVCGVVLTVFFPSLFDFLHKRKKKGDVKLEAKVNALEQKLQGLEERLSDKDEKIGRLENEISFVNKLIEERGEKT